MSKAMTTQDRQSEIEDILGTFATYTDPCEFGFEDIIIKKIEDASHAIEAYVTTRVKEAERLARIDERFQFNNEMARFRTSPMYGGEINRRDKQVMNEAINTFKSFNNRRIRALTTTTNGKE